MSELLYESCKCYGTARGLAPQHAFVFGGTALLEEFLQIVAQQSGGELTLCTPFIEETFVVDASALAEMKHDRIDVRIVTRRRTDAVNAWSALQVYSWRSVIIWQCPNLHAKVYSFVVRDIGLALVGSHNLTRQGLGGNIEAGVLFKALVPGSELTNVVFACQEYVTCLTQKSKIFVDSSGWPRPDELLKEEVPRE